MDEATDPNTVTMSIVAQLSPLRRPDGQPFAGNLQTFADSMCAYVATNLERFADVRGGDSFVQVHLKRGEEQAGGQFRSGHYVKDPAEPDPGEGGSGAT